MLFTSFIFWIFFFIILTIFTVVKPIFYKKIILLAGSLFFLFYWDFYWGIAFFLSICINYLLLLKIKDSENNSQKWLILGIFLNVSYLFIIKYLIIFQYENFILPIGISFYTFQNLGSIIDAYRDKKSNTTTEISFLNYALFISFFPQLIAGPIERIKNILPQFQTPLSVSKKHYIDGFYFICFGLFQKVFLGDTSGKIVDVIFSNLNENAITDIILCVFLFSIQIYADFAGYSNIARGLAKCFGIDLMLNFSQPYWSKNIKEFWQSWHISLSQWLRDYLYIPLGGNRFGKNSTYFNLLVVMLLGGIWHGNTMNFLLWGLYHGLLLIIFKKYPFSFKSDVFNVSFTFILVTIGWLFFRLHAIEDFNSLVQALTENSWYSENSFRYFKITFAFLMVSFGLDYLLKNKKENTIFQLIPNQYFAFGTALTLVFFIFAYLFSNKTYPFIYFQF